VRKLVVIAAAGLIVAGSGRAWTGPLTLPDGSLSVDGLVYTDHWWDTASYKRVVTADTINAQAGRPVTVSGRLSDFQFENLDWGSGAFIEVGLMADQDYQAMEDYDPASPDNWDDPDARGSNKGIYLIVLEPEMYLEDWGGYWPPDGGNFAGQYYPSDDGQTVFSSVHFDADTVVDFSFTLSPQGSAGGTVDADVAVTHGAGTDHWSTHALPYGRFNPARYDPDHTGDGSDWALVEDFSQAHLFVNILSYSPGPGGTSSFSYSGVQAAFPVPEPGGLSVFALGLVGLVRRKRRS